MVRRSERAPQADPTYPCPLPPAPPHTPVCRWIWGRYLALFYPPPAPQQYVSSLCGSQLCALLHARPESIVCLRCFLRCMLVKPCLHPPTSPFPLTQLKWHEKDTHFVQKENHTRKAHKKSPIIPCPKGKTPMFSDRSWRGGISGSRLCLPPKSLHKTTESVPPFFHVLSSGHLTTRISTKKGSKIHKKR